MKAGQTAPEPPTIGTVLERIGAAAISFDADQRRNRRRLGPDARTVLAEDASRMPRELTERGDFMTERHAPDRHTLREQGEVELMEVRCRRGE